MNRAEWAKRPGRSSSWCKPVKRLAIYIRDGFQCAYCAADLKGRAPREMALDHLNPKVNGGWHHSTNLVLACRTCNSARHERPWRQFVRALYPTTAEIVIADINRKRRRKPNYALAKSMMRQGSNPEGCNDSGPDQP